MKEKRQNGRLDAALSVANKPKRKRAKSTYFFSNPKNAKMATAKWLKERGPKVATATMRIHKDAVALAQSAWKDRNERVIETSGIIREAAKKRLGL